MDAIIDFLQNNWYLTIVFLAITLILIVTVIVLCVRIGKLKRTHIIEKTADVEIEKVTVKTEPVIQKSIAEDTSDVNADEDIIEVIERQDDSVEINSKDSSGYVLTFDRPKNNWIIRKKGAERATRRAATKEEAIKIAKELSRKHNVSLVIKKKDGRFQKQR